MPNPVITTRYGGEVTDNILVRTATGNELFENGLINIKTGIKSGLAIPRLQLSKLLQKRKANPTSANSKGNLTIDERKLEPQDIMVYMEFNPARFEHFWKQFQPTGEMVFQELPAEVQIKILQAVLTQSASELGIEFLTGEKGDDEGQYFDGIITRILASDSVVKVECAQESQIERLRKVWKGTDSVIREKPEFVFLTSKADADAYDDEITDLTAKGKSPTEKNPERFKGHRVVGLAGCPEGLIVGTLCSMDENKTNLFAAVNMVEDFNCIQVDKVSAASELYFVKMLMKADTQIAWDEAVTICDNRANAVVEG